MYYHTFPAFYQKVVKKQFRKRNNYSLFFALIEIKNANYYKSVSEKSARDSASDKRRSTSTVLLLTFPRRRYW